MNPIEQAEVERIADILRGIFPAGTLDAISPPYVKAADHYKRLAITLFRAGLGVR